MCAVIELNFFTRKIQGEIVALAQPVDVSLALRKVDFRDALDGVTQAKAAEVDHGIRSQAEGAAIFEFNFGAAAVAGPESRSLRDRKVQKRPLESHSCIFVDLDRSLYVTQANNTCLRLSHGGQRYKRAGQSHQNARHQKQFWLIPTKPSGKDFLRWPY